MASVRAEKNAIKVRGNGKQNSSGSSKVKKLCEASKPNKDQAKVKKADKKKSPVAAGSSKSCDRRRSERVAARRSALEKEAEERRMAEERRAEEERRAAEERRIADRVAARAAAAEHRRELRRVSAERRMAIRAAARAAEVQRLENRAALLERMRRRDEQEELENQHRLPAAPVRQNSEERARLEELGREIEHLFDDVAIHDDTLREQRMLQPEDTDASSLVRSTDDDTTVDRSNSMPNIAVVPMDTDDETDADEAMAVAEDASVGEITHTLSVATSHSTMVCTSFESTQDPVAADPIVEFDARNRSVDLSGSSGKKRRFESIDDEDGAPAPKRSSGGIRSSICMAMSGPVVAVTSPGAWPIDYDLVDNGDVEPCVTRRSSFGLSDVAASLTSQMTSPGVSQRSSVVRGTVVRPSLPPQRRQAAPGIRTTVQAAHCSPDLYQALAAIDGGDTGCLEPRAQDKWLTDSAVFLGLVNEAAEANARGGRVSVIRPQVYREFAEGRAVPRAGIENMMYFRDRPEVILIPLHHGDGSKRSVDGHWALAVYTVKAAHAVVYDSLPPISRVKQQRLGYLKKMLKELLPAQEHQRLEMRYAYSSHVDRQKDGYNCGIHVIVHARRFLGGRRSLKVRQNDDANDFNFERRKLKDVLEGIKIVHENIDPNVVHQVYDLLGLQQNRRSPRDNSTTNARIRRCFRRY